MFKDNDYLKSDILPSLCIYSSNNVFLPKGFLCSDNYSVNVSISLFPL